MLKKDECGCVVERKFASDYLVKRLYNSSRGKEICNVKIDSSRWFKLYRNSEGIITYKCSECPIVIICLEALCEAYEEDKKSLSYEKAIEKLRSIKGFQINQISDVIAKEFSECVKI